MKHTRKWVKLLSLCAASAALVVSSPTALSAKGYASLDKLPDWSGVWQPNWQRLFAGRTPPKAPPYTPEAQKTVAEYMAKQKQGENLQSEDANCVPPGVPRVMRMPYPIEFLFTPGRVTVITEAYMQVRRIYTDGRKLPDDPDEQYNGNSIGHWEGNTLVVETVGLNHNTTLGNGLHPTDATRIVERFHMDKPGMMTVDQTITDPSIYTEPVSSSQDYARAKDWAIREYICEENNRDKADPFGRPSMSLGNEDKN